MINGEDIACDKCAWFSTVMGQNYCYKHKRVITLNKESCCIHFVDLKEELEKSKEEEKPKEENNTNKVCSVRLRCFTYGKEKGVCADDLFSTTFIAINPNNVLYKTAIKEFELPLSGRRTGKRYFCIVMVGDYYICCPESEFDKI